MSKDGVYGCWKHKVLEDINLYNGSLDKPQQDRVYISRNIVCA